MAIEIKKSKQGSLRKIAKRAGAIKEDGTISMEWINSKLNSPNTSEPVRKKLQFAKNARSWD